MREILFKGFHECENGNTVITVNGEEKRGEWVEGDLLQIPTHNYCSIMPQSAAATKYYDVIPETVSQYTGLTDKNGKRIFEGDIVPTDYKIRAMKIQRVKNVVFFEKETCAFSVSSDFIFKSGAGFLCDCENIEIIGNIFSNPELLEDK